MKFWQNAVVKHLFEIKSLKLSFFLILSIFKRNHYQLRTEKHSLRAVSNLDSFDTNPIGPNKGFTVRFVPIVGLIRSDGPSRSLLSPPPLHPLLYCLTRNNRFACIVQYPLPIATVISILN